MSEAPLPDDLIGRVLAGRFRIERQLGRGGMGAVYVAVDERVPGEGADARVAVKVVRASLLEDAEAIARFKREARLLAAIQHENIVRCIDVGDDGGVLYIAMELVDGESLRDRLEHRGRMTWRETLPVVQQIVRALGAAHDHQVVHRDLKPENIVLVDAPAPSDQAKGAADIAPTVKLLDFGIAKRASDGNATTTNMTGTGFVVGTPGYVAPEVVLGGVSDDLRADFYALGVTWFEMLTGQVPFTAKTPFALALRHAQEPAPTPTSVIPFSPIPPPVEQLVMRLLQKTPEARPATSSALLALLVDLEEASQRVEIAPTSPAHATEVHLGASSSTSVPPASLLSPPLNAPPPSSTSPLGSLAPPRAATETPGLVPSSSSSSPSSSPVSVPSPPEAAVPPPPPPPSPPFSLSVSPSLPSAVLPLPPLPPLAASSASSTAPTPPAPPAPALAPPGPVPSRRGRLAGVFGLAGGAVVVAAVIGLRPAPSTPAPIAAAPTTSASAPVSAPVSAPSSAPSSAPTAPATIVDLPAPAAAVKTAAVETAGVRPPRAPTRPTPPTPPTPPTSPAATTATTTTATTTNTTTTATPSAAVTFIVKPEPAEAGWRVGVDGETPTEGTRARQVTPGAHKVRFISRSLNVDVTELVDVGTTRTVYRGPKAH